jgi:hypothetical protein
MGNRGFLPHYHVQTCRVKENRPQTALESTRDSAVLFEANPAISPLFQWIMLPFCSAAISDDRNSRRSISRVLSTPFRALDGHSSGTDVTTRLKQPTRAASRKTSASMCFHTTPAAPIRSCSRWGLPCPLCYQRGGALLPHRFTLTWASPGGLFSVALSLGSPPPDVIRHRFSVEPGLSSSGLPRQRPSNRLEAAPYA